MGWLAEERHGGELHGAPVPDALLRLAVQGAELFVLLPTQGTLSRRAGFKARLVAAGKRGADERHMAPGQRSHERSDGGQRFTARMRTKMPCLGLILHPTAIVRLEQLLNPTDCCYFALNTGTMEVGDVCPVGR